MEAVLPENYPEKEYANKKAIFDCKIINVKKHEKTNKTHTQNEVEINIKIIKKH